MSLTFTLAIAFLGVGTIIGGLWQDRVGPRLVATVAGVIYGISYLLASYFTSHAIVRRPVLQLRSARRHRNGDGIHHAGRDDHEMVPRQARVDDGRRRRGIRRRGADHESVRRAPIAAYGVPTTFETLGVVYLVLVVAAAQFYCNPPPAGGRAGWQPTTRCRAPRATYDYAVAEAMRTWQFWMLWLMLFLNVSAGIMIISQASPMAQQMVGMTPIAAAGMVGLISIFNGAGRVFWAWVSDHIGRARVYLLLYVIQAVDHVRAAAACAI